MPSLDALLGLLASALLVGATLAALAAAVRPE